MNALSVTVDNLAVGENEIRVGFVLFHGTDSSRSLTDLSYSYDKSVINNVLANAVYADGNDTDVGSALDFTCGTGGMFSANKGDRSSAQNYLVLLSDGITDPTVAKSSGAFCRNNGVILIGIGIGGTAAGHNLLKDLVQYDIYPNHYLNTTYSDLGTTLPSLVTTIVNCSSSGKT